MANSDYRLTKPQQNSVHAIAVAAGLDPADFRWAHEKSQLEGLMVTRATHLPTGAYFLADAQTQFVGFYYSVECWPNGSAGGWSTEPTELATSFGHLVKPFTAWLRLVKEHHEAPDLWAIAQQQRAWLSNSPDAGANTAFSKGEREVIQAAIGTIAEEIRKLQPAADRLVTAETQLKYLVEAADRLGRFDWRGVAISTLLGVVINLAVDVDTGRRLLALATQLLGPLVSGVQKLLS